MNYSYIKVHVGRVSAAQLLKVMNEYGANGYRFVMATDGYLFFESPY